ncbi:hypothetical protein O0881_27090 [Janthinobacterium sp. SUN100]|uniref:hypothetical protein n=1 Tax=Janthinobacterium sp. SUN100 TaxID=3004101 RepID=UPI0025AFFC58|nr:hypothetical protein [Janthinobacterium sp. SUN100]MDN2705666.1 hypothetical protein [Janthinobacterium sp. SUN100]
MEHEQGENVMMTKAERVSKRSDGTWSQPNSEYPINASISTEIDLNEFERIATIDCELPCNDEKFPKGAIISDTYKVGNGIFRRKLPLP